MKLQELLESFNLEDWSAKILKGKSMIDPSLTGLTTPDGSLVLVPFSTLKDGQRFKTSADNQWKIKAHGQPQTWKYESPTPFGARRTSTGGIIHDVKYHVWAEK